MDLDFKVSDEIPFAPNDWEFFESWIKGENQSGWVAVYHCVCDDVLAEVLVYRDRNDSSVQIVLAELVAEEYERDLKRRFKFTTPEEEHDELQMNITVPVNRLHEELYDVMSSWVAAVENSE